MAQKKRNKIPPLRAIYYCLLAVFLTIFLACAAYLGYELLWRWESKKEVEELGNIRDQILSTLNTAPSTDPSAPTEPIPTEPTMLPELQPLYEMNNDLVGWIQFPGTSIDHPVMQTPDNPDYYLKYSFEKEKKKSGSIYVREQCDVFAPSDNVVIYGHYSKGGGMFYPLKNYTKKSYWQEHQTFTFDTLYQRHTYQIIAVFKTTANFGEGFNFHWFNDADSPEEFDEYVATVKELAMYDTGITAEYGDKLVSLCTCEYTLDNGRLVVVAKRIS